MSAISLVNGSAVEEKRLYCTFDCFLGKRIMMFVFDCVLGSNQKNDTTTQASLIPNRNSKRLGAEPEQCKANWLCITQRGRGAPRGREQKARGSVKISATGCTKHHDRIMSASRGCISHNFTCSSSGLIRRGSGSANVSAHRAERRALESRSIKPFVHIKTGRGWVGKGRGGRRKVGEWLGGGRIALGASERS